MPTATEPDQSGDLPDTTAAVNDKATAAAPPVQSITAMNERPAPSTAMPDTNTEIRPAGSSAAPTTSQNASEPKLSNAELKKRAKAEKQAKRAQKKADAGAAPGGQPIGQLEPARRDGGLPQTKPQSTSQQISAAGSQKSSQRNGSRNGNLAGPAARGLPTTGTDKGVQLQSKGLALRSAHKADKQPAEVSTPKESKHVALFGHLTAHPRRTTIAGAKDVHPAILALGLQLSNYVICGSSARSVATLLAFKRVIESYTTPVANSLPRHLTGVLSTQIEYLVSCRPLSISQGNAIRWLKLLVNNVDVQTPESRAKAELCESIDNFIRERITVADQLIASESTKKIQDGDTILTFAKSHVVSRSLLQAHAEGKKFKVIVVDSRPLFEGKNLARTLSEAGLEVQYSLTHAISHLMKSVTKVFLGAHAMFSNGRLYSRVGTAIVAMHAKDLSRPVIVCCESIKFTDRVALDSIVTNEVAPADELLLSTKQSNSVEEKQHLAGWQDLPNLQLLDLMYDVTPATYIDMVITEYGILPPSSVMSIHRLSGSS